MDRLEILREQARAYYFWFLCSGNVAYEMRAFELAHEVRTLLDEFSNETGELIYAG